jgi:hypothetical protein
MSTNIVYEHKAVKMSYETALGTKQNTPHPPALKYRRKHFCYDIYTICLWSYTLRHLCTSAGVGDRVVEE